MATQLTGRGHLAAVWRFHEWLEQANSPGSENGPMTTGSDAADDAVDSIALVPEPSRAFLYERQLVDYRSQRRKCLECFFALGKAPDEGKGLLATVQQLPAEVRYLGDGTHEDVWTHRLLVELQILRSPRIQIEFHPLEVRFPEAVLDAKTSRCSTKNSIPRRHRC